MRRSKLESCEAILGALTEGPLTVDQIAYETSIECGAVNRHLEFLVRNEVVEERAADGKTEYAITERGIIVFKTLSFQKYLERVSNTLRAMDDAIHTVTMMSSKDRREQPDDQTSKEY